MDPTFFKSQSEFRSWLKRNHNKADELWVGLYKKETGVPGISYQEALDEALCFGWIDGVRKSIDENRWVIRFTRRKPHSVWSAVNIRRVGELTKIGRMEAPGLRTFEERDPKKAQRYSYENRPEKLDEAYEQKFSANSRAWEFFQAQPPSYKRTAIFWVMAAKKEETRLTRLAKLIEDSQSGKRLDMLSPGKRL